MGDFFHFCFIWIDLAFYYRYFENVQSLNNRAQFTRFFCCSSLECSFISLKSLVWLLVYSVFEPNHHFDRHLPAIQCLAEMFECHLLQTNLDTSLLYSGLISSLGRIFIKLILSPCGRSSLPMFCVCHYHFTGKCVNALSSVIFSYNMKNWCTM